MPEYSVSSPALGQGSEVHVLECTIRDGGYAVDFQFTEADTGLLVSLLSRAGFRYVEIGHGFGLNAAKAGKGPQPASDAALIQAAKGRVAKGGLVGMFCIPGIATMEALQDAVSAGLDFVRVGADAPEIEKSFPFVTAAREAGLFVCLNFMKSYAVTPKEFSRKARAGADAGAHVVYLVDSSGGMLPPDVRAYCEATREQCDAAFGFHGHNNLQLGVANCLEVVNAGGTFIDATLYGLGRSAGNPPTEVVVALLDRLGYRTGVDLFELMDICDEYFSPLMRNIQMHDMTAVAAGYGQFHSSFMPLIRDAANRHKVDARRLLVRMAAIDPCNIDPAVLEREAAGLPKQVAPPAEDALTAFGSDRFGPEQIDHSLDAVGTLVGHLASLAAKRRGQAALLLAQRSGDMCDAVLSEFLLDDDRFALGRVVCGSSQVMKEVIAQSRPQVGVLIIDSDDMDEPDLRTMVQVAADAVGRHRVVVCSSSSIVSQYLAEHIARLGLTSSGGTALVWDAGLVVEAMIAALPKSFGKVVLYRPKPATSREVDECSYANVIRIEDPIDWRHLGLNAELALYAGQELRRDLPLLSRALAPEATLVVVGRQGSLSEADVGDLRLVGIDVREAFRGHLPRWLEIARQVDRALKGVEHEP